jgi:archaellum component FlaG (FlaF/FlaG flagellin family)
MKRPTLIISACVIMLCASVGTSMGFQTKDSGAPQTAPANPKADKIKRQVKKIGTGADITVELTNTHTYHGAIKWIDEDKFQIDEVDLKQVVTVNYSDTKKVYAGYGGKGITGQRVNPKKGLIAVAILAGVLATVLIVGKVGY